ncbi:MAG: FliM/FliN family flagellar motor switch protein [Peptococcaceae bacterium]|nr:FliM/FliN family flagellar motor switch protein [Peptococcaceae bacterium]
MLRQEEIQEFLRRMSAPDMIKKVEFPPFDVPAGRDGMKVSINFMDDVQVVITAELGQATMKIKDILRLAEGSVIELEQPAGENARVLINDQKLGTGEVVVIGGSFGIRMDSICQIERKETFGKV